ncbi:hypothetical protein [Paraburkholderia sp. 32]|uniref:hypothetical protein n=1 Tax=Paraburkholderia sp. 32 TaxID=2991057 RepID=UPI003D25A9C5
MGPIRGENRTTPQRLPEQHNVKNANQSNKKEREECSRNERSKRRCAKAGRYEGQRSEASSHENRGKRKPQNENACYRCEGMRAVQDWYRRNPHGIHSRIRRAPIFFMR